LGFPNWPVIYFINKRNQAFWHHHHRATISTYRTVDFLAELMP
jgi:hypothetical protein